MYLLTSSILFSISSLNSGKPSGILLCTACRNPAFQLVDDKILLLHERISEWKIMAYWTNFTTIDEMTGTSAGTAQEEEKENEEDYLGFKTTDPVHTQVLNYTTYGLKSSKLQDTHGYVDGFDGRSWYARGPSPSLISSYSTTTLIDVDIIYYLYCRFTGESNPSSGAEHHVRMAEIHLPKSRHQLLGEAAKAEITRNLLKGGRKSGRNNVEKEGRDISSSLSSVQSQFSRATETDIGKSRQRNRKLKSTKATGATSGRPLATFELIDIEMAEPYSNIGMTHAPLQALILFVTSHHITTHLLFISHHNSLTLPSLRL